MDDIFFCLCQTCQFVFNCAVHCVRLTCFDLLRNPKLQPCHFLTRDLRKIGNRPSIMNTVRNRRLILHLCSSWFFFSVTSERAVYAHGSRVSSRRYFSTVPRASFQQREEMTSWGRWLVSGLPPNDRLSSLWTGSWLQGPVQARWLLGGRALHL